MSMKSKCSDLHLKTMFGYSVGNRVQRYKRRSIKMGFGFPRRDDPFSQKRSVICVFLTKLTK